MASRLSIRAILLAGLACATVSLMGQTPARPAPDTVQSTAHHATHRTRRHEHAALHRVAAEAAKPVAPQTPVPPLPTNEPAQPATVKLDHGQLTVQANNSDLDQILNRVASISGTDIEGLKQTTRVFGVYGPGNPQDVLSDLLSGMGYNFVMVGSLPDGSPRELVLTPGGGPLPEPTQARGNPMPPVDEQPPDDQVQYGPGAIQHVPPNMQPGDQDNYQRQQENMQRLEQMRQQMQQQQQQQQDNPQ